MSTNLGYPLNEWLPMLNHGDERADTAYDVVSLIISHPTEMMTRTELEYMSGTEPYNADYVDDELELLVDAGILTRIEENGFTMYGLTDAGKQFLVDTKTYRVAGVYKAVYMNVELPDEVKEAYDANRPDHPPTMREYEEQDIPPGIWEKAQQVTYRVLQLELDHCGGEKFTARLVNTDDGSVLDEVDFEVDRADLEQTRPFNDLDFHEQRGKVESDDTYEIILDDEGSHSFKIKAGKGGEEWSTDFERCLYVFRKATHKHA